MGYPSQTNSPITGRRNRRKRERLKKKGLCFVLKRKRKNLGLGNLGNFKRRQRGRDDFLLPLVISHQRYARYFFFLEKFKILLIQNRKAFDFLARMNFQYAFVKRTFN